MKLKAVRWGTSKFLLGCYWQLPENNDTIKIMIITIIITIILYYFKVNFEN